MSMLIDLLAYYLLHTYVGLLAVTESTSTSGAAMQVGQWGKNKHELLLTNQPTNQPNKQANKQADKTQTKTNE